MAVESWQCHDLGDPVHGYALARERVTERVASALTFEQGDQELPR